MKAIITCPECKAKHEIEVPEGKCLYFWKCPSCGKLIQAPKNECCVVCAYSDKKCPVHGAQKH
ncbi:hypothetical protein HZB89_00350 [archaeon]|nr:hypothetical protein [archaeon]